jgi:putative ABC transport system substrate-binding protein
MRRREFIALAGAAAAWPLPTRAQQSKKIATIGFLGAASAAVGASWANAFVQRLQEVGFVEGKNIHIEYRWAEGRAELFEQFAKELVDMNVDIIVTWATAPALAVEKATSKIPIVFALATDPVGSGLVASLARPSGNATGLSAFNIDLIGKRLEILREIVPNLRRLAIMANVGSPDTKFEMHTLQQVAEGVGIATTMLEITKADEIPSAFNQLDADAIFVVGDPLTFTNRNQINALALNLRLPATYAIREFVQAGGLISYGPNFPDLFRRAADLVSKLMQGTKVADIPVEQPTTLDLVINLKTARALGLTIPLSLLGRADEVIE